MKKIITIYIILISSVIYSQNEKKTNIKVEYEFIDLLRNKKSKSILICNDSTSIFATYFNKKNASKATANNDGDIIIGDSKRKNIYHISNKKNIISYKSFNNKDIYKVIDSFTKLNWKIEFKDTKIIQNYNCNKAQVSFRGRLYTAWYSTDIPISFGPWKFSGLPGIILEISDKTNTFSWVAKTITYPSNENIAVPYKKTTTISIKKYQEKVTEYIQDLRSKIESKIPRKYGHSTPNKKNSRAGIELIFEWEVNEK